MPVWHAKTRELVASGELTIVGIVQEQHPDRTALYAQWQEFGWPILWDPFGLTGLEVVPVVSAVDEYGVVRLPRPDPRKFDEQFVAGFMERSFEPPDGAERDASPFRLAEGPDAEPVGLALSRLLRGGANAPSIDEDVALLSAHAEATGAPTDRFRAGVALRMRSDGPGARPGDFQAAVDAWRAALHARPNQYIWRRRIQQWGPRLDKPYAFYDWIDQAAKSVAQRGDAPVPIRVPLSGSEIAGATRAVPRPEDGVFFEPDFGGTLVRDEGALVRMEVTVALHTGSAGPKVRTPSGASRVHVALRPVDGAHWTPDADPPVVWLELPGEVTARSQRIDVPGLAPARGERDVDATTGPLRADFELSTPPVPLVPPEGGGPPPSEIVVPAYAVYSVCLPDDTCVFRRQDFEIRIPLPAPPGPPPGDDDDR